MKLIKYMIIGSVIIGAIGFALNFMFGKGTITYITQVEINGVIMQKYDFWGWYNNVKNAFTDATVLELTTPSREWISSVDLTNWFSALQNNLLVMLDWFLFSCNVIFYPFRIIMYGVRAILAIVGIPIKTANGYKLNWLIDTVKVLVKLQIPYSTEW